MATKRGKIKTKRPVKQMMQTKKKSNAWFILAIIALAILVLNIVVVFTSTDWLIKNVTEAGIPIQANFTQALMTYAVLWLVLAIITLMLIITYKSGKNRAWWLMLILGIVVLFTGRLESAVLLIIASFLYKGNTR